MQMQVQGTPGTQTDFVAGARNNEINAAGVQLQNKQETEVFGEQKESYQPSEEALLRFYYEQMKSEQEKADAGRSEQADIAKLMRIAQNIMRGKQVPSKDESYLVKHNLSLYMAAKNLGSLREPSGRAKSVLNDTGTPGTASFEYAAADGSSTGESTVSEIPGEDGGAAEEAILQSANAKTSRQAFDASKYQVETERSYGSNSVSSSSGAKKVNAKKKYKKFRYNFKSVSSQIVKAKTSMSARQAAGRARRQTTDLRRKLVSGEYDRTYVRIALTHAEAIERVAKKKIRHLLEEERIKRGGECAGNNDKFDKEEQQKLDEQAYMEMWNNFRDGKTGAESESENLVELFTAAVQQSAPAPEVDINLDELMMEFEELMQLTMEEAASWYDLADEMIGDSGADMDPEDLKLLKIKHRSKEQQEIAEADARFLRAFFSKLQKDQEQTAAAISQIAEAAIANTPVVQLADTGGGKAAALAVETASAAPAANTQPAAAEIAFDTPASSAGMKAGFGGNIGSPSVSIDGVSFDISI